MPTMCIQSQSLRTGKVLEANASSELFKEPKNKMSGVCVIVFYLSVLLRLFYPEGF